MMYGIAQMPIRIVTKQGLLLGHITINGVLTKHGQLMTIPEHKQHIAKTYSFNHEPLILYNDIDYGPYCCSTDHKHVVESIRKSNAQYIDSVLIKCIMELKGYDKSDVLDRIRIISDRLKE